MGIKNVKSDEKKEVASALRYTRMFIIFGLIIALIAVAFFAISCKTEGKNKTIIDGLGNGYVNSAQMQSDYIMATQRANTDSLSTIGVLFRAAATMEQVHMAKLRKFYEVYTGGANAIEKFDTLKNIRKYNDGMSVVYLLDSTKHSLAYLMGKQSYMVNSLFESLATQAGTEKNAELAKVYNWFLESETSAYRLFGDAYKNFEQAYLFTDKYNVCPQCGNIYIYGDNVKYCTVCSEDANKFILVE